MSPTIKVRYQNGLLVPLAPIHGLNEGDILEFQLPDPGIVYQCETERQVALDNGRVVRIDRGDAADAGADETDV